MLISARDRRFQYTNSNFGDRKGTVHGKREGESASPIIMKSERKRKRRSKTAGTSSRITLLHEVTKVTPAPSPKSPIGLWTPGLHMAP